MYKVGLFENEKVNVLKCIAEQTSEEFEVIEYEDTGKFIYVTLDYGDDEVVATKVIRYIGENISYGIYDTKLV